MARAFLVLDERTFPVSMIDCLCIMTDGLHGGMAGAYGNGIPVMPLLEGSPAIDAGIVMETTTPTDITGRLRNVGKAPDIGAFERQ